MTGTVSTQQGTQRGTQLCILLFANAVAIVTDHRYHYRHHQKAIDADRWCQ